MPEIKTQFPQLKDRLHKKIALKILLKSMVYAFAIFGILIICLLAVVFGMLRSSMPMASVPDKAVLMINFDNVSGELKQDTLLTEVVPDGQISFQELITALSAALSDDSVKAVAARINTSSLGLAQTEELYHLIRLFEGMGKHTYIYSPGFGSLAGGTDEYYLASAFSNITMQPNSDLGFTGVGAEVPFFRNVLDKVGITPEFYARYEYKTAMSSFTDKEISPAFAMELKYMLAGLNIPVINGITAARFADRKPREIFQYTNSAPFSAEEAKEYKFIDDIAFEGEWRERVLKESGAEMVDIADYAAARRPLPENPKFAIITLEGTITDTPGLNPMSDKEISSAEVLDIVDEIAQDSDVKGVLVRINSPGGSYTASAEIWNALNRLKAKLKVPLVVSMGDYAASGGYLVALAGDKIFADETTITGSIGVIGGKFVLEDLWKKLGVEWADFPVGKNSGILSSNFKFNAEQKATFNKALDRVYDDFTLKVSEARKIPYEQMNEVARGRIFTGNAAKESGLVDEIGGFCRATNQLKTMAGVKDGEKFGLEFYPRARTLQEKIGALLSSAPLAVTKSTAQKLGLDVRELNMLQQLQYDAVMPPILINK